jgi:copper(I)-binding protein
MLRVTNIAVILTLMTIHAQAHSVRVGNLEFVHPVIMVPRPGLDHTCAHVKIINYGDRVEYFRGVRLNVAGSVKLLMNSETGGVEILPIHLAILPGRTLDLRSPSYCIFLSGLRVSFEADIGAYPGELLFEQAGEIDADFMVDASREMP